MRIIEHGIDIPAPAGEVWNVLTATEQYAAWNPFILQLDGRLQTGHRLTVTIRPRRMPITFKPTVVAVDPGRLIRWQGRLGVPGILDGEHELNLEPIARAGTRFTQRETFTGVLIPLMRRTVDDTLAGFAAMNRALRDRTLARMSQ